jgi:hypothetical protein
MPKVKVKPGDIFEVQLKGRRKAYLQYLFQDSEYLGGHLVRAFYDETESSDLKQIVTGPIAFYSYTRLTQGIDLSLWHRIGNVPVEKTFDPPFFRQTPDTIAYVQKSYKWNIFRAGSSQRKKVGELTDEYKRLPVAAVFAPVNIVRWLEEGKYPFKEPE